MEFEVIQQPTYKEHVFTITPSVRPPNPCHEDLENRTTTLLLLPEYDSRRIIVQETRGTLLIG